jgi:hypothetical protein
MQFGIERHGEVDHFQAFRDHNCFALNACNPVTIRHIVPCNLFRDAFPHGEFLPRDDRTRDLICIRAISANVGFVESFVEVFEGGTITTPAFPITQLSCITIHCFPAPALGRLFFRSCHISSTSRITAVPSRAGFSSWARA